MNKEDINHLNISITSSKVEPIVISQKEKLRLDGVNTKF
jgi:hypothetical protein